MDSNFAIQLGERIRNLRKDCGFSQAELGANMRRIQSEVGFRTVSDWETGRCLPDAQEIAELCRVLQCSPSFLLDVHVADETNDIEAGSGLKWRIAKPHSDTDTSVSDTHEAIELFRLIARCGYGMEDIAGHEHFHGYGEKKLLELMRIGLYSNAVQLVEVKRNKSMELELKRHFAPQLKACYVADTDFPSDPLVDATLRTEAVAFLAARKVIPTLPSDGAVGVTGGTTISRFVDLLPPASPQLRGLKWYPLLATQQQTRRTVYSANSVITRLLHRQPGSQGFRLSFLDVPQRTKGMFSFLSDYEREFVQGARQVHEEAEHVEAAFISVGTPEFRYKTNYVHLGLPRLWDVYESLGEAEKSQCVGDVLLTLLNENGQRAGTQAEQDANDRLVYSIGLQSLRKIAKFGSVWVLAARTGNGKARVINAALKGGLINSIVVDVTIAQEMLKDVQVPQHEMLS